MAMISPWKKGKDLLSDILLIRRLFTDLIHYAHRWARLNALADAIEADVAETKRLVTEIQAGLEEQVARLDKAKEIRKKEMAKDSKYPSLLVSANIDHLVDQIYSNFFRSHSMLIILPSFQLFTEDIYSIEALERGGYNVLGHDRARDDLPCN